MVNRYLALGYLSSDPDYRKFDSGKSKSSFSMGINYGKETTWIEVECWDKIADNANHFLKKGSLIFIEGKMKSSSWKDKNGFNRSKLICVCDFFKAINTKAKSETPTTKEQHNVSQILEDDVEIQKELEEIPW
jgi:single-strand DNA-binding protein